MDKREFTLYDLIDVFKKHWWVILLAALIVGGAFAFYSIQSYEAEYTAEVTFYVAPSNGGSTTEFDSSDVNKVTWAQRILNSYIEILNTDNLISKVDAGVLAKYPEAYEKFGLSRSKIKSAISTSVHEDSSLFTVKFRTKSPESSYDIADVYEGIVPDHILSVTKIKDTITVVDSAAMPVNPSNGKNFVRNTAVGLLLGALVSYIIFFMIELFDVRVKNEDDLLGNYQVPLLGSIPDYTSDMKAGRQGYSYGKQQ